MCFALILNMSFQIQLNSGKMLHKRNFMCIHFKKLEGTLVPTTGHAVHMAAWVVKFLLWSIVFVCVCTFQTPANAQVLNFVIIIVFVSARFLCL